MGLFLRRHERSKSGKLQVYVFMDEHADTIFTCAFATQSGVSGLAWLNGPSARHAGAATVGFTDGHCELHRWVDPTTMAPETGKYRDVIERPNSEQRDIRWVFERTIKTKPVPF